MNQDNTSTFLYYLWIAISGLLGIFNLRGIINHMSDSRKNKEQLLLYKEELKAKETKIIMLEAKIVYWENKFQSSNGNTN